MWNSPHEDFLEISDWDSQLNFDSNDDLMSDVSEDKEHRKLMGEWESDKINSIKIKPLSFTEQPSKWSLPFQRAPNKTPKKASDFKKHRKYMGQWKSDKINRKMKPTSFVQQQRKWSLPYPRAPNKTPTELDSRKYTGEWKSDSMKIKPMDFTEQRSKWSPLFQRAPNAIPTEMKKTSVSQRSFIKDLRNIASLQKKILSALKKVELKSKGNKNCSLHDLVEQRAALADLESDASRLTLR